MAVIVEAGRRKKAPKATKRATPEASRDAERMVEATIRPIVVQASHVTAGDTRSSARSEKSGQTDSEFVC